MEHRVTPWIIQMRSGRTEAIDAKSIWTAATARWLAGRELDRNRCFRFQQMAGQHEVCVLPSDTKIRKTQVKTGTRVTGIGENSRAAQVKLL
jgi:hypothetical protein